MVTLSLCIANYQHRKLETNIPRKEIARPQSQFPHSCVRQGLYIPTIDLLILLQQYVDRSWEYINRSYTHECGNCDWGRAIPRNGICKWTFRCSAGQCGGQKKHGIRNPRHNVQGHIDQGHNITSPVKGCDQYIYTDRLHIFHMFHARNQCVYNL
jgi:hypothetical protein